MSPQIYAHHINKTITRHTCLFQVAPALAAYQALFVTDYHI